MADYLGCTVGYQRKMVIEDIVRVLKQGRIPNSKLMSDFARYKLNYKRDIMPRLTKEEIEQFDTAE